MAHEAVTLTNTEYQTLASIVLDWLLSDEAEEFPALAAEARAIIARIDNKED